jgi:hypothetical protein
VVNELAFGADYAETLRRWRADFLAAATAQVQALGFDTRFMRIWEFYLAYCEAAFATGNTDVMQFTLQRPGLMEPFTACTACWLAGLWAAERPCQRAVPAEVAAALPGARMQGSARLRFLGLSVYDARLWSGPTLVTERLGRRAAGAGDLSTRARSRAARSPSAPSPRCAAKVRSTTATGSAGWRR